MQRRSFLGSIFAAGFAPAFVGSSVLMPVKALTLPSSIVLFDERLTVCAGESVFTNLMFGASFMPNLIVERTGIVTGIDVSGVEPRLVYADPLAPLITQASNDPGALRCPGSKRH
jgi:hypothetical protein